MCEGQCQMKSVLDSIIDCFKALRIKYLYVHGKNNLDIAKECIVPYIVAEIGEIFLINLETIGCPPMSKLEPSWVQCDNHGLDTKLNKSWLCAATGVRKMLAWLKAVDVVEYE